MHPILEAEAATEQTMRLTENRTALRQLARRVKLSGRYLGRRRFEGTLQDISRRGLRIRSATNVPCGQQILIQPPAGVGLEPIDCRVMRVQVVGTEDESVFDYGVQITAGSRDRGHRWFLYFCYGGMRSDPPSTA